MIEFAVFAIFVMLIIGLVGITAYVTNNRNNPYKIDISIFLIIVGFFDCIAIYYILRTGVLALLKGG